MDCQVALSPDLGINAFQFITAWNQTPACRAACEARLSRLHAGAGVVFDPSRLRGNTAVLDRLPDNIEPAALHALLRQALAAAGVGRPIQIQDEAGPDGVRGVAVGVL